MSWIQDLFETYENCRTAIGVETGDRAVSLLPLCHTTQKAQIEITIDGKGNFRRARVISKEDAQTIIPCTEKSGGRTSGEAPHPLCDKLQYVAVDYQQCGGTKKPYFKSYIGQLENWANSEFTDPKIRAVLAYVKKGHVVGDLIAHQVLVADKTGKLLAKWDKKKDPDVPPIFQLPGLPADSFVRWAVEIPDDLQPRVWQDQSLWEKWYRYYISTRSQKTLCYVTGEQEFLAEQHLGKLRNDGDRAKLISSNDTSGFTFRGRFVEAEEAAAVGLKTTQKAHLALRWLIRRQGYRKDSQAIVAWAKSGHEIPQPTDDPIALLGMENLKEEEASADTAQDLAVRLKKKIAGYRQEIGNTTKIVVMGLDSATPGRMAITYYRRLTNSDFLERIEHWHEACAWLHQYRSVNIINETTGKSKKKYVSFIGAPAPATIAEAAYGQRVDEKLRKITVGRILTCIIDGSPIPRDLVESAVRRAANKVALDHWEWEKTLTIACALYRKYKEKESYQMALDPNRVTRDYLYGRLLALAESLEEWALNEAQENRTTNAARLMQRFSERPFSTWRTIELSLAPYKARLGGKSIKRQRMIDEVIASFEADDFTDDSRLSGEFLLGYHCQREALRHAKTINSQIDAE